MRVIATTGIFLFLLLGSLIASAEPLTCSYTTYKWNVFQRKAVSHRRIQHPYHLLADHERDPGTGCTVCEEDQQRVDLPGLKSFRLCRRLVDEVVPVLQQLVEQGEPIHKIIAYRVGMTRGDVDTDGNRTRFSNHSFGIAIDINDEQNGLYDRCFNFGPHCRLIKGGEWVAGQHGSLDENSEIVQRLKNIGLKWGGKIRGRQKDFMHFSPTGY